MRLSYIARVVVAVFVTALGVGVPAVHAADTQEPTELTAGRLSMDQAVKMAEQRFKARVVRAEAEQVGDQTVYVLRMLNESGRVWTVRVDASNGDVL